MSAAMGEVARLGGNRVWREINESCERHASGIAPANNVVALNITIT